MKNAFTNPLLVIALTAAAFWDAWRWYIDRVAASPEEGLSLALTIALTGFLAMAQRPHQLTPVPLMPLAALLVLYAASHTCAPAIVRAAIATVTLLYACYRSFIGTQPPFAFFGLVALALPVVPSLQFVLGYPMRIISASITVALLQLEGLSVRREGTHMLWNGEIIQFDAPCSGVNMLWGGLMLTLAACVVWRSGSVMTFIAIAASLVLTLAANILRATSLFYIEAGLIPGAAPWWHEFIGLTAFALSATATIYLLERLRARETAQWAR